MKNFPGGSVVFRGLGLAGAVVCCGLVLGGCPVVVNELPLGPVEGGAHWLRFALLADVHILDEESPARVVGLDFIASPAWRPQDPYTVQVLDATLQALNARHAVGKAEDRPVDFLLLTGDLVDNAQYNELDWFVDTMDGRMVTTDSGVLDGVLRDVAEEENPKLPYAALGLSAEIPWYVAHGNHDGLCVGNFRIDTSADEAGAWHAPILWPLASFLGWHHYSIFQNTLLPTLDYSPAILRAREELIDAETLQLQFGLVDAGYVAPDENRHFLSRSLFARRFLESPSQPKGHGFTEEHVASGMLRYSFRPQAEVPVRVIVLDTVPTDLPFEIPIEYGVMSRAQFEDYLKPALRAARLAGEYVIIATHHPANDFDKPYPGNPVKGYEWRSFLSSQPQVIAHVSGHTHKHHVARVQGLYDYLEIETGSLIDLPQQGRLIDLYLDPATNRLELTGQLFSHLETPTVFSEESYFRALVDRSVKKSGTAPVGTVREALPLINVFGAPLAGEETAASGAPGATAANGIFSFSVSADRIAK